MPRNTGGADAMEELGLGPGDTLIGKNPGLLFGDLSSYAPMTFEFLARITGWKDQGPLKVKVVYYACSDGHGDEAKAFCRKVEQVYLVHPERDRGAGSVQARTGGRSRGGPAGRGGRGGGELITRLDGDKDGRLTREEVKGTPLEARFDRMDQDGDGVLSSEEIRRMQQRMRGRGGGERRRSREFDV